MLHAKLLSCISLLFVVTVVANAAQPPGPGGANAQPSPPAGPVIPPMVAPWDPADQGNYPSYDGAREAIRRNAEWKAAQRRQRIEHMKWMGYSPLRPPASPLPYMGSQATWVGMGVYYPLPGVIYQPALPGWVVGQSMDAGIR